MTRRASLVAWAVVTAVNAAVLLGVARDQGVGPGAEVWLDERELSVESSQDNSAVTLHWRPQLVPRPGTQLAATFGPWLDTETLSSLGFDCSVRPGDPRAGEFYSRQLGRRALVAFDLARPGWTEYLGAWQERARERLERSQDVLDAKARETLRATIDDAGSRASRLVPVGAALDAGSLRARYPDGQRQIVMPAVVRVVYDSGGGGPALSGRIVTMLPEGLQVPSHARSVFVGLDDDPAGTRSRRFYGGDVLAGLTLLEHRPRFRVRVSVSPGGRPRVEEAQRLP